MTDQTVRTRADRGAGSPASQQVSWWPVHEFITAAVAQANYGPLPIAGTPAWCELADGDPRKLLALAVAGDHHVLRVETAQAAMADASREISAAADWTAMAQRIRNHSRSAYIPRRKSA
ncbi:DUF2742 domain-containing protein [Mycolicibacterium lutetiense]|uniref:DUF2742 domain-containing protein n=1 Tax=Mycolicibacterium lutetiense TaxID=1641992 RepID=A0ABS5A1D8_9MYCO|nr:DUF2742 domain-containing protein [Mycolicibacterium lutetiense]MBP2455191.1 hypothetical protein [Mycolicibacterium lutetiense]